MVAGIDAVKNTLNPPIPRTVPIALGLLAVVALLVIGLVFVARWRASANARTTAQQRTADARRAAGVAIADLGRRVNAARDQGKFDQVSYGPENARRIATVQERGERLFAEAQAAFDAAEDRTIGNTLTPQEHAAVAAQYDEAVRLVQEASGPIEEAEQRRIALDRAGTPR